MTDDIAALLSSGVLQRSLLPRLPLADLLSFERVSLAFGVLLESVSAENGVALQQLASQRAIRTQDFSIASAEAGTSLVTDVSCSGDLVAVFLMLEECDIQEDSLVCLFHLANQEPLHQLSLSGCPGPGGDASLGHQWSPDGTQLAIYGPCWHETEMAWLSHSAMIERTFDHCDILTPVRFSPCSRLLCFYSDSYSPGPDLMVLNSQLETVYAWPAEQPVLDEHKYAMRGICHVWTPSGNLVAAARLEADEDARPPPPPQLELVYWHDLLPGSSDRAEKKLISRLVRHLRLNALKELAWSPAGGLAALAKVPGKVQGHFKLYVLLPGARVVSTAIQDCDLDTMHTRQTAMQWSPAGNRLILDGGGTLRVLTPACKRILRTFKHWETNAAFDPSGRCVAAVCCGRVLYRPTEPLPSDKLTFSLYSAVDGTLRFSRVLDSPLVGGTLSFSSLGDQLVLTEGEGIHIISFGQACKPSSFHGRQLCDTIAGACTWASEKFKDQSDDEGMHSTFASEADEDVGDVEEAMQLD